MKISLLLVISILSLFMAGLGYAKSFTVTASAGSFYENVKVDYSSLDMIKMTNTPNVVSEKGKTYIKGKTTDPLRWGQVTIHFTGKSLLVFGGKPLDCYISYSVPPTFLQHVKSTPPQGSNCEHVIFKKAEGGAINEIIF